MKIKTDKLQKLLVGPGYISKADFELAVKEAKESKKDMQEVLIESFIKDEQLGRLIAKEAGFSFINLRKEKIEEGVLDLIPELVAQSKGAVAFARTENGVKVGMLNPDDLETKHLIEKRIGEKILPYFITKQDLQSVLASYKSSLKDEFKSILQGLRSESLTRDERDELIIKTVDILLYYGYQNKASDIHIEPRRKKASIRFRIDGVLHRVQEIPKDLYELILLRIKILAKIRIDEHQAAQDGKLRFKVSQEMVDVRVSIVPVTEGGNIVMRLLSAKSRQFSLMELGLSEINFRKVQQAMKYPHGMILVTGPTGSGKTTSLYEIIKILNNPEVHIATIEDPVEYDIEGVSQIQVNPKTNLTFAKGLRAIVRQDPDIILIGEIRDQETADIAINSALTGHLVLSTLHTNNAATTLPRLLEMGIEPFLVASSVNMIIAQRLVRKICEKCRMSYIPNESEFELLPANLKADLLRKFIRGAGLAMGQPSQSVKYQRLYKGKGCRVCNNTGFLGRTGIFEILEMTEDLKRLITEHATSGKIMDVACAHGMTTMLEDGIQKALTGITTIGEVIRVTRE